jgi:hypothetical protein
VEHQVKRIIKFALFGDGIGPISAEELVSAATERWELWRRMITDAHQASPRRDLARCLKCMGPVYIKTKAIRGVKRPLFAHYAGADANCPWFTGQPIAPDDARASQYGGAQESDVHRLLCNVIAELAAADPRAEAVTVDEYLPPTANAHGRYPDVYLRWTGLPPMAIELQLSRTFQTEISARCGHYDREGMPLIWVLYGVDLDAEDIPQSFRDVLSRHRMNAFLLDQAAIDASHAQKTLVLSCRLAKPGGGFEPARQVRLDTLTFPPGGLPFVEDRLTPGLVAAGKRLRKPWFDALKTHDPKEQGPYIDMRPAEWDRAFAALQAAAPSLAWWLQGDAANRAQFAALVAVAFTVVTHAQGQFTNYATAQDNVTAMLNSRLTSKVIGPYAFLLRAIIRLSSASDLLKGSVGRHIGKALDLFDGNHCLEHEPEWEAMEALLPEIFDQRLRAELAAVGASPSWTAPFNPGDDGAWLYAR